MGSAREASLTAGEFPGKIFEKAKKEPGSKTVTSWSKTDEKEVTL